jgi:hypothetical protein
MHERQETPMEDNPREVGTRMAVLAAHAALPLSPERAAAAAAILSAWLPAAHELNRKMGMSEHRTLMPVTVFAQAPDTGDATNVATSAGSRP